MAIAEISYGVIPLKREGSEWRVLLIKHVKGHWAFPKGHSEVGELPKETAERELGEETGLKVVSYLKAPAVGEHYFFEREGETISKTARYYLAEVEGELVVQEEEIDEARWLPLKEAEALITFDESKRICRKVRSILTTSEL